MISSQDFRNAYEPFYDAMRLYLWPYDVLELLGNVEVGIYTAFIDREKLANDFYKLRNAVKETIAEDEDLQKQFDAMQELIDSEEEDGYQLIQRVGEVNQEKDKVLKNPDSIEEEENESKGGISYENKQSWF